MRSETSQVIPMVGMLVIGFGVHATYQNYRGTDLSRVPRLDDGAPIGAPSAGSPSATSTVERPAPAGPPRGPRATARAVEGLELYPTIQKGMRTPFDLWAYYGRGVSSFDSPVLPMRFEQWLDFHRAQKPQLMKEVRAYMADRYDFSGEAIPGRF